MRTSRCPLCGGERRFHIEKFGRRIDACAACGTAGVEPLPSDAEIRAIYTLPYFQGDRSRYGYTDYAAESAQHARSFTLRAALLEELLPRRGGPRRVLDIGCANGSFLAALGPGWEKHGVEVSEDFLRASPPPPEIRMFVGDVLDYPDDRGPFDAVTLFDVLDHVPRPLAVLDKAVRLLRPGGVLVVQQGDRMSLFARLLGRRWHIYIPPTHLWYFTRSGLHRFLRERGLRVARDVFEPRWASVSLCLFRLSYILPAALVDPFRRLLDDTALGRLSVRFNFRDVVTVYARKADA